MLGLDENIEKDGRAQRAEKKAVSFKKKLLNEHRIW